MITKHNEKPEIKMLVDAMVHHFPLALKETDTNRERVFQIFKLKAPSVKIKSVNSKIVLQMEETIDNIDRDNWNGTVGGSGVFDWMD